MSPNAAPTLIVQQLQQAIEQLHQHAERVEIWAGALRGFAQPVPQYDLSEDFLLPPHRSGGLKGPPGD